MGFSDWDDIEGVEVIEGLTRKLITGEKVMMCRFEFEPNISLPRHKHPHEQISYVLKGELEFTLGDETKVLKAGELCLIPSNVEHGVKVGDKETIVIDVFSPIREDFLK